MRGSSDITRREALKWVFTIGATAAHNLNRLFAAFIDACLPQPPRTLSQFALDEIIVPPGGPAAGESFSFNLQPFAKLLFDEIDKGEFRVYAVTGPLQDGKTFFFIILAMYFLFERKENVIYGLPTMQVAQDKWNKDFLPVIMASRYRDQIATTGEGSEGGKFVEMMFKNGCTLRFMSAKGGEEVRSGVTSRILIMTEVDKYDTASETAREGDRVSAMIGRLEAFDMMQSLVFMECSTSTKEGRIYREVKDGSDSKIVLKCPLCGEHGTLEREHLKGWQQAENEVEVREKAYFICPTCDQPWTEEQRVAANLDCRLIHRGQTIDRHGVVTGPRPPTYTLGFRWSAANSLLKKTATLGWKEWKAKQDPDEDNSEKKLLQYTWALPWSGEVNATGINPALVASRVMWLPQFVCPEDTEVLVCQIDIHFRWHYYTLMALGRNPNPIWLNHVEDCQKRKLPQIPPLLDAKGKHIAKWLAPHYSIIDYGLHHNLNRSVLGPEGAMMEGLKDLTMQIEGREYFAADGEGMRLIDLDLGTIDAGFRQSLVIEWITSYGGPSWRAIKGQGRRDLNLTAPGRYLPPKDKTEDIYPGDHWHDSRQPACKESGNKAWWMLQSDTSYWMHQMHAGYVALPFLKTKGPDVTDDDPLLNVRRPGSIALYGTDVEAHLRLKDATVNRSAYATQVCGWLWSEIKKPKEGVQVGWNSQYEEDHWGDTTYPAMVAGHVVYAYHSKFRKPARSLEAKKPEPFKGPDGRPYFVTDRE